MTIAPALSLPEWTVTFTTVLLILGFPVAVILAWTFDVVRTGGTTGSALDARTIASGLGCRHVVEGGVRKIGDRVRVTVPVIDALIDRHV